MKKFRFLFPVLVAMIMVVCFVQCQKEQPLGFKITCYYEDATDSLINDADKGYFYIDTSKYLLYDSVNARYNYCDTTLAKLEGKITKGIAQYEGLRYPALLRVVLSTDTMVNEDSTSMWLYRDTIEVKVEDVNVVSQKDPMDNNPAEAKAYLNKIIIF